MTTDPRQTDPSRAAAPNTAARPTTRPDAQIDDEDRNDPEQTAMREVRVTTTEPIGQSASPRQPNDRDESPDSQASGGPRRDMQQAATDLASGQVDTDRHEQPDKNPLNRASSGASPHSSQTLPDGRRK